jgi:hypothetical protein
MRKINRQMIQRVVFAILVFLAAVGLSACASPGIPGTPSPPPPIAIGTFVGVPGVGLPAIHHHGVGTLTPGEIKTFVLSHQFLGGPTQSGQPPTVLSIETLTAKAVNAKYSAMLQGKSIGLPDTSSVIVVMLSGPFAISNVPSLYKRPFIEQSVAEMFDAKTGNLLFYWPSTVV